MPDTIPTPADVAPPAQAPDVPTPTPAAPPPVETDWKAEARKWEQRAKENAPAVKRLAEIEEANKTAEQKSAEAIARGEKAEARALRLEVALSKRLDPTLAARLQGSTKEELEADADALMALIPKAPEAPPAPPVGPTVPGQQPGGVNPAAQITRADLDALGAAGKTDEINRLRREGRLSHLLG